MKPENMPYYSGPKVITPNDSDTSSDANHCQTIISTVLVNNCHGFCHLSNIPVKFGNFGRVTPSTSQSLHNNEFPCYALQVLQFSWAVYSFQGGHFASTIQTRNFPFHVTLACDPFESGCSLFQEFTSCRQVFGTATEMQNHIRSLGDTSLLHGYMIHSPCFHDSDTTTKFWQVQAAIISDLRLIRSLWIVITTIHPDHDGRSVKTFIFNLKSKGWVVLSKDVSFLALGNTIAGRCRVLTTVHSSCAPAVEPMHLKRPPSIPHRPLGKFIWEPLTAKNMQFHWLVMITTLPNRKQASLLQPHPLHWMRPQEFPSDTTFTAPTPILWLLLGLRLFLLTVYVRFSMPLPLIYSSTTLGSSFMMRITATSTLFHHTNLSIALASPTISPIPNHTLRTSMHWMPQCLAAPRCGCLSRSTRIFRTFVMPTVKSSHQTNSLPQLLSRHLLTARSGFAFLLVNGGFRPIPTTLK